MKTKLFTLFAAVIMAANAMAQAYIDLGLPSGTLWTICNVGATIPEEAGDYFAWAETQTKSKYDWTTYTFTNGAYNKLTKYCSNSAYGNNNFTDTKTVLDASDDVVTQQWGEGWSIPTQEQWQELIDHCTWEENHRGYLVKSKSNNNSIFLPVSGFYNGSTLSNPEIGYYWSSTLNSDLPYEAYRIAFSSNASGSTPSSYKVFSTYRSYGQVIRPVHVPVHTLTVTAEEGGTATGGGDYNDGKTATLTATPNAGYIFTGWSDGNQDNPRTVTVTQDSTFKATFRHIGAEYVDLGLPSGTLWATFNVGAFDEHGRGDHFAWGETKRKNNYSWSTYTYGTEYALTKYCSDSNYGTTDTKVVLDSIDDAASVIWQGKWRTPIIEEWQELIDHCTWEWKGKRPDSITSLEDRFEYGYLVTSKTNGKQIFLPAAGYYDGTEHTRPNAYGNYWSASLNRENPNAALRPDFAADFVNTGYSYRREGLSVRPVQTADKYTITITDSEGGTVTGGGEHFAGRTATLTAIANEGYIFKRWSDGVTDNPRSIQVTQDMTLSAEFEELPPEVVTPEYVDLGLSSGVLWATFNVGATAPEEHGDHFSWGETAPRKNYSYSAEEGDYKHGILDWDAANDGMIKYNKTDGLTVLEAADDAATANWGSEWRTPTQDDFQDLMTECAWDWDSIGTVKGYIVSNKTDPSKYIFLPVTGYYIGTDLYTAETYGHYWSATLSEYDQTSAWTFVFYLNNWYEDTYERSRGRAIRPVRAPQKYTITFADSEGGTATGGGEYIANREATLTAVPAAGYIFKQWSDGNTENPRVVTVTQDSTFTAQFERSNITYTLTVNAGEGGTVTGGGTYPINTVVTIEAIANEIYTFRDWSDGVKTNPRTIRVTQDSTLTATFKAFAPEYVDLGLTSGTLWATFNVGAYSPEEYGDYFAWGETEPKTEYEWENYRYLLIGDYGYSLTKYCYDASLGYEGYTDTLTTLEAIDDAATVNWGENWRMPTADEAYELVTECNWQWTDDYNNTGVAGCIVSSKADVTNAIFLPATGVMDGDALWEDGFYAAYWSSSLLEIIDPTASISLYFYTYDDVDVTPGERYYGQSVRPVYEKNDSPTTGVETPYIASPDQVRKVLENGQVIIIRDGVRYNVLGIKVK